MLSHTAPFESQSGELHKKQLVLAMHFDSLRQQQSKSRCLFCDEFTVAHQRPDFCRRNSARLFRLRQNFCRVLRLLRHWGDRIFVKASGATAAPKVPDNISDLRSAKMLRSATLGEPYIPDFFDVGGTPHRIL